MLRTQQSTASLNKGYTLEDRKMRSNQIIKRKVSKNYVESIFFRMMLTMLFFLLKKYEPSCVFCGNVNNVTLFKGKLICADCLNSLKMSVHN